MARIRAMRSWFSGERRMWKETVERFLRDPERPDFAAVHLIGDIYNYREDLKTFRQATTLDELRSAYGWYPLSAFERLNQELVSENPEFVNNRVRIGTKIKIPSPGFATLMACRLSAGVVGDNGLTPYKKMKLVQATCAFDDK